MRWSQRGDVERADGFDRERIEYRGLEGDLIPAFLFTPTGRDALGGVVVFHQHNGEFHFGKSEVAGEVDERFVGVAGHLYGGYTALYHAAVDARYRFACISGAVCSLETRRREGTGITHFETVPGLAQEIDTHDALAAIGPRPTMVVSGADDKYSRDAGQVVARSPATSSPTCVSITGMLSTRRDSMRSSLDCGPSIREAGPGCLLSGCFESTANTPNPKLLSARLVVGDADGRD